RNGNEVISFNSKPGWLVYLGITGLAAAVLMFMGGSFLVSIGLLGIAALLIMYRSGVRVNVAAKTVEEFSGFVTTQITPLTNIEGMLFTSAKVRQLLESRGSTTTIHYTLYKVYLKANSEKILLAESKNKKALLAKAQALASGLQTELHDQSA